MKWTYQIPNKLATALMLLGVLLLVFFNNLKERSNSTKLESAFESIYEDRLMAESYILRFSANLHEIQDMVENQSVLTQSELKEKLAEIEELNLLYLDTELTQTEETYFVHFEKLTWDLSKALSEGKLETATAKIRDAHKDLHALSEIQVTEAQVLLSQTRRIFSAGSASSQFEIGVIIIIALMVQAILFASKTLQGSKSIPKENLN